MMLAQFTICEYLIPPEYTAGPAADAFGVRPIGITTNVAAMTKAIATMTSPCHPRSGIRFPRDLPICRNYVDDPPDRIG